MRDRLKNGEPICDYTKTDWNDCCECSAKDCCDKCNERSEIISELLGEVIDEIKNEGRRMRWQGILMRINYYKD